jgi:hypothetical protein
MKRTEPYTGPFPRKRHSHNTTTIDMFLASYIETALWSSHDMDESGKDIELDSGEYELAPETLTRFRTDCADFEPKYDALVEAYNAGRDAADCFTAHNGHPAHDFWLTRNGHGAGFWDGDYPEPLAMQLTDLAEMYGHCDLYIGDDGLIYC